MNLEATVIKVLPEVSGEGKNGTWRRRDVVFTYKDGTYDKTVCMSFSAGKVDLAAAMSPGQRVQVWFNVESREYNGKWYTNINAWKAESLGDAPHASQADPDPDMSGSPEPESDLPF